MRDLEKSARADDLAASAAVRAIDGARPGLGAFPVAFRAGVELANLDFLVDAESRLFQRDLHVVTQIGPALPAFAIGCGAATEKRFENSATATAAENFAKNIEGIVETAAAAHALTESRVTETIVGRALIGIHQDIVGFSEFLKFFLRVRVARIFIGMILDREFAVGALHFILGRGSGDSEHLVVVALFCRHSTYRSYMTYEPLETTTLDGRSSRSFILYPRRV